MKKQIIYSSHPEIKQIKIWQLTQKGKLKKIQKIFLDDNVQPMYINKKKKILYAGIKPNFGVVTFKINSDGTLKKKSLTLLPGSPSYICTDKNNDYFFSASYNQALFTISKIKKNGVPNIPYEIIKEIPGCHSVNLNLNNNFLFVPALLENCIYVYKINRKKNDNIKIKFIKKINNKLEKKSGPRHMAFHPNEKNFYNINELDSSVDTWEFNNEKINYLQKLHLERKKNLNNLHWASDIHIDKKGKYLYACDRAKNIITSFKINKKNGLLKIIEDKKIKQQQPRSFNIDTSGKYILIAGQKSNSIGIYKINNKNGKLKFLKDYFVGNNPIWITNFEINK